MKTDRRRFLLAAGAATLAASLPARADGLAEIRQRGSLRVAVYNGFTPWSDKGNGIDVELAQALGKQLGLATQVVGYNADEDMDDDLRNMVWKGHYLGQPPSDVMMHVPVDSYLQGKNDKVKIFGPYHLETIAVARVQRIGSIRGSAATALEVFTREKIGVEGRSLADAFLLGVLNGRLRENVVHFNSVAAAVEKLKAGELAAVMGPRSEIEQALGKDSRFAGYLLAATGTGSTAPYRQLFAAIGADKSPGGICVIEDTGAPFDELTEEIPQGITVSLPPSRATRIGILKQHHVGTCVRVHSGLTDFPADLSAAEYVWLGLR